MAARETLDQLLEQKKTLEDRIQRRLASERKKKVNIEGYLKVFR